MTDTDRSPTPEDPSPDEGGAEPGAPVFFDRTGRRWRKMRQVGLVTGVLSTILFFAFALSFLIPPLVPEFRPVEPEVTPRFTGSRQTHERRVKRDQLYAALKAQSAARSIKKAAIALRRELNGDQNTPQSIRAAFYVSWADNSLASFRQNAGSLDWVICEWGFLTRGGDSVDVRPDTAFFGVYDSIPSRPKVLLLVNNFDRNPRVQRFDSVTLRRMLGSEASRARVINQIMAAVLQYKLGGVTIDFENIPNDLHDEVIRFDDVLHQQLAPRGLLLTTAVLVSAEPRTLRAYAKVNDYLFVMLYDEHYGGSTPGPVASQQWYTSEARRLLEYIPPRQAILTIGGYGYDWNDGDHSGETYTFQEVLAKGRDVPSSRMGFDRTSLNPYMTWTDPDSTDHLVWYLDAATGYNQMRAGQRLGAAGYAMWRLGDEDPSFWRAAQANTVDEAAAAMAEIQPGYIPEFTGDSGEILRIISAPKKGERHIVADTGLGLIVDQRIDAYSTPYIIQKYGAAGKKVALTFDDGPDGNWTPMILDTLRSRNVSATFFVIGRNVEAHIPLMRRIVREGNLFGNHTFTHPDLSKTSDFMTRLELDANQRLLEAVLNRRSFFFRPPYFGDAEPTTNDELVPVEIASRRHYVTVGLHIDAEDWVQRMTADSIVANVLDQRYYGGHSTGRSGGNVILLHDGGGDRSETVRALGPLIDSLRAHGDTIVPLSELAGISKEAAMPGLPPRSALTRDVELATFSLFSIFQWTVYWLFFIAVVVGGARLVIIVALAAYQRFRRRPPPPVGFAPVVTIIVPAYNEQKVVVSTVQSLLNQTYTGPLDIIVVDDGSPDETYDVVIRAFRDEPRVVTYRKPNGGKASALNYGIARARGEIIVCLDADTQFTPMTVERLIAPMHDENVGAVAGNAKVGNRHNLVTRWQALEYVASQNLDRRAFAVLNAITIVPGAVGAWRKSYVQAVGGFSEDTLAEDQDLTWALGEEGARVVYADDAVAYTEAPDTLGTLARQRFRWTFGTLQCAWKHRRVFLRPRYGALGMIAMPNIWIFQIFYTAISPLADVLFLWSLLSVLSTWSQHGSTYALDNLENVLTLYAIFLLVDWLAAVIAFLMEPGEDRRLTWLILIQRFVYRQTMYWVVLKSIAAAARGHVVGWGKLERKGMGLLPTTAPKP